MSSLSGRELRVTSAEFVRHFGAWQDRAANDPVTVTHHGRARLVLLAAQRYQQLTQSVAGEGNGDGERLLATLLDRLDASFVALDGKLCITMMNAQAASYFKVDRGASHGIGADSAGEALPDLARSIVRRHLQRTLASGEAAMFDAPSHAFPGEWLRFQAFPFADGAALLFRNVTVERALRRMGDARDSLALALATHGDIGTATISQRARIVTADAAFAAMVERAPDMLDQVRLADLFARQHMTSAAIEIEAVLNNEGARIFDTALRTAGGGERPVCVALAPLGYDYGIEGATVVMTPLR